ncbi:MAG: hypothetical protein FWD48_09510 [Oscillospiraceae bacterium]|nr:hypothetical protein [Oscillospiraceae bacterium]
MTTNVGNEIFQLNETERTVNEDRLIAKRIKTEDALWVMFCDLLELFNVEPSNYRFDKTIIQTVSFRYFRDVLRIHCHHRDIPYIDSHKIAGYITYWICKLRPINVVHSGVYHNNKKTPHYINELFAFYVAIGRIKAVDFKRLIKSDNEFLEPFLYTLKFRPVSGDSLSMEYYLLENQKDCG